MIDECVAFALTIARDCSLKVGNSKTEHASRTLLESCTRTKHFFVPSQEQLVEKLCADENSIRDLVHLMPMDSNLPSLFKETLCDVLLKDCPVRSLPGRLMASWLFTYQTMLACLHAEQDDYVIALADSLSRVMSDPSIVQHVLLILESTFMSDVCSKSNARSSFLTRLVTWALSLLAME
jgi:hypothetical protein